MYDVLAYLLSSAAFRFALARMLAAPYRAAAALHRARTNYFEARLTAAKAEDDWRRYKTGQSVQPLAGAAAAIIDER